MKKLLLLISFLLLTSLVFPQKKQGSEKIRILKKWKLTEYLDLTEKQAEKFFPRLNELENHLEKMQIRKEKLYQELDAMTEEEKIDEERVNEILDELSKMEKQAVEKFRKHLRNIDDILTPGQKAKYILFEEKFKKLIKEKLGEGRESKPKNNGSPRRK